ncbi:MAG: helix-turn-helix domain-containing protein [Oscillospiraceae bacterium]|nr:helix-turn-helix domain-containing protein [Oscillospiraceae bacterium]MBR6658106.1 helix-turn-helix domain-containing protein [Oscillospiraceae bacterium]
MSVIGSRLVLFFGLGFLVSLIILIVAVVLIVRYANKRKPLKQSYVPQEPVTPQQEEIRKTLGETLKELRTEKNMTQEFVAESLGVSRQAVSKWENGSSEPSTSNLIAIAKLYEIPPEELLKKLV